MCICWRRPGLLFSVLCSASLCKATNSRGQAVRLVTSDPCPLPRMGGGYLSAGAYLTPRNPPTQPPVLNSQPWGSPSLDVSLWHQELNWDFYFSLALEQRSGHQHRTARTVWPAGGSSSRSQPTCLYYNVLTKSPVSHHPFPL